MDHLLLTTGDNLLLVDGVSFLLFALGSGVGPAINLFYRRRR